MIYIILLLAAFLRLYRLGDLPISLFGDEIDVGYHAWSLFTTLRDYTGHLLPTYIRSLAEFRAPLLMYLTAPFVGFLGPSAFSVRFPVALLGILNVYQIYLIANLLFSQTKSKVGLFAAFLLAITPWHLHYSRAAFETTLLFTLLSFGVYLYLKNFHPWWILPLALTFYTYSTAVLFIPFFIVLLLLIYRPKPFFKRLLPSIVLFLLLLLPFIFNYFTGQAGSRFAGISIFADQKITDEIITRRTMPWVKIDSLERLFDNRPLAFTKTFITNYLQAFSPQFLFLSGDPNYRHSIGNFGELLLLALPLLFLGFWRLITLKTPASRLVIGWLLLAPIPAALTQDGGMHATRLFLLLPPLIMVAALGWSSLRSRFSLLFAFALILNLAAYWHHYATYYRFASARVWHAGYEAIFSQLAQYQKPDTPVYINNSFEPSLLRYAFYTKLPPAIFQKQFKTDTVASGVLPHFDGFLFGDKVYFGKVDALENLISLLPPGSLFVVVQGQEVPGDWDWSKNPPAGFKNLAVTRNQFGDPQFYLMQSLSK